MSKFDRTRAALAVYDAGSAERMRLCNAVGDHDTETANMAAFDEWQAKEKADADLVRAAFAEDTSDVNSRDRAFLVYPNDPWLRALLVRHP